jgi:hypothetical protein
MMRMGESVFWTFTWAFMDYLWDSLVEFVSHVRVIRIRRTWY